MFSYLVIISKANGKIRICVDLTHLNKSVRERDIPLPRIDEILAQLKGAKVFNKIDAMSGFRQTPHFEASHKLTTFITPSGRFCFNKLPFGISSVPEHFQKRMCSMLGGLDEVL